ncbi:MAG: Flp pilus assembly complex ATPase component TadA [Planctomycetes bacterium]|nr:Flp pilus assembly complex ATPase component TadA [Planctomycetota bacterium]
MATPARRKPLGQILKEMDLLTEGDIQDALQIQRESGGVIGQILVDMDIVNEEDILFALAAQEGLEVRDLTDFDPPAEALSKVPAPTAQAFKIIPIQWDSETRTLTIAFSDPRNVNIFHDLKFMLNCEIEGIVATAFQINGYLEKYYGESSDTIAGTLASLGSDDDEVAKLSQMKQGMDLSEAAAMANAAPVVKLLNLLLLNAIRDQASDIHFEPFEDNFRIRYRVDGILYEMESPPVHLAPALISRVKVMSNLDIAETRMPQDGRIEIIIGGKPIDLRVSTLPTMFGESCVMRILDRSVVSLDVDNLGFRTQEIELIKAYIDKPNGIILVTGPTGSGKTTTLYSCLNYANDIGIKLITTEDPVEYDLDGIIQVQVNDEVGLTYANCLRSILRQDPDKILVGEVRDKETANIAVEASLTGHIVFTTLHTNDAPSAVTRMLDIGIENFLLAATLEIIVAQRLVRRICAECKTFYVPSEEQIMELGLKYEDAADREFAYGKGCDACNFTGHRGRMAIFELMQISDTTKQLIMEEVSTAQLREQSMKEGMKSLRDSGILGIYDQQTTIEEVIRETLIID